MITHVESSAERKEVRDFLAEHIRDIAPDAVPLTGLGDEMFRPTVVAIRGAHDKIIAAALTCRAQVAALAYQAQTMGTAVPGDYLPVLDKHRELDLIAVDDSHRNQGLATQIVTHLDQHLAAQGIRVWFGNVTHDSDTERLRAFYLRQGFKVLDNGQALPPLLGRQWSPDPPHPEVAFHFYKRPGK